MPSKVEERGQAEQLLQRLRISPVRVEEGESPDFILELSGKNIGLEVTEGVYQEYRRGELLKHSEFPANFADFTHLKDRPRRRSNDELRTQMLTVGGAWEDYGTAMTDWSTKIECSLERKRNKLNSPKYKKFEENWLLIFDQPPLDDNVIARQSAIEELRLLLAKTHAWGCDFDAIYVLSGRYLFRSANGRFSLNYDYSGLA